MRGLPSSIALLVVAGLFWGLAVGFLPYPVVVTVKQQGDAAFFLGAIGYNLITLVAHGIAAGLVGSLLSLALEYAGRIHRVTAVGLWVLTGFLSFGAGRFLGTILFMWFVFGGADFRFALSYALKSFAEIGPVPILLVGLLSYPAFLLLTRLLCKHHPADGAAGQVCEDYTPQ